MRNNINFTTRTLLVSTIAAISLSAASIPNSGDILREVAPKQQLPLQEKTLPNIPQREYKAPIVEKDGMKVMVKSFKLSGNTIFKTEVLLSLVSSYNNKELTLAELKDAASVITKYYRDKGYFVARAYIPAQELDSGVVEIAIIEGLYGSFEIKNSSLVNNKTVQGFMDKLQGGDVVSTMSLERQMLLINDLAGAEVTNAEVLPGKEIGTSDFRITAEPTQKYSGYAIADNYGSKYTGRNRVTVSGSINSVTGIGDSLGMSVMESLTTNLKNGSINYAAPIGYSGLKADASASITTYKLASEYESSHIHGIARTAGAGLSYPIIKTRSYTLNTTLHIDHKELGDSSDSNSPALTALKKVDSCAMGVNENRKTALFGKPGMLNSSVTLGLGTVYMDNATAKTNDATLNSEGNYAKLIASISHTQSFTPEFSLQTSLKAQTSLFSNLDSSEDFSVGGAYGVRGYTDGELSGDKGVAFGIEPTYTLPAYNNISHKLSCFYDYGRVIKNTNKWSGLTGNERTLQAVGVGYAAQYRDLSVKASFARGIGANAAPTAESNAPSNKLFVQLIKGF